MNESSSSEKIRISPNEADEVRKILEIQTLLEAETQGKGDTEIMRLCCAKLFSLGLVDDILRIWRAKEASFDSSIAIEIQLLCGAGLEPTKAYLQSVPGREAADALAWIAKCKEADEFAFFDIEDMLKKLEDYFE